MPESPCEGSVCMEPCQFIVIIIRLIIRTAFSCVIYLSGKKVAESGLLNSHRPGNDPYTYIGSYIGRNHLQRQHIRASGSVDEVRSAVFHPVTVSPIFGP